MRIGLEIRRTLDLEAASAHHRLFLYRLWARIRFRTAHGWSEHHFAIVDTGAPYTLIPASLWPVLRSRRLLNVPLRGIAPHPEAAIRTTLAQVTVTLIDARSSSPPLTLLAALAETERVPLILGWAGCLDRAKLVVNAPRRTAWLEF